MGFNAPSGLPEPPPNPVVGALEHLLYSHWFCPSTEVEPAAAQRRSEELAAKFWSANRGRERRESGFIIGRSGPGGTFVWERGKLVREVWPGEFVVKGFSGSSCKSLPARFAIGQGSLIRFYWNVRADGADALFGALSERLERYQVPFRFECLRASDQLVRRDGAVLYVGRRHFSIAADVAAQVQTRHRAALRDDACPLTKRVAPGLCLAEDPIGGGSFGMHRCRVVAEGLFNAYARGITEHARRLRTVIERFEARGLDPARPWLNPGSLDGLELPAAPN
jgi:hypothetical protein